jgi:GDPmannose 4,6-dehydratase
MDNIADIIPEIRFIYGDLLDQNSLVYAIEQSNPDEVYHLAGQSHVGLSFQQPISTLEITGLGTVRLLEALRLTQCKAKLYNASTSELFGDASINPQDEHTPFAPRSPYGCAKLLGHTSVAYYRAAYDMFACSGILFNHESPKRGVDFVTRKISMGVARIACGLQDRIELGNIYARRDWGFAGDYVKAMWLMLQQDQAKEYVIATGETHSILEFVQKAFEVAEIPFSPERIVTRSMFFRASDIETLCGDSSRAHEELQWYPEVNFDELVRMMVESDLFHLRGGRSREPRKECAILDGGQHLAHGQ